MLISVAFAEDKTVQKRGLLGLGYGGLGHGGGLLGGELGHGSVAVAIQEKPVAVPVAVPKPYPVAVDRPVPVKVRKLSEKSLSSCYKPIIIKLNMLY